VAWPVIVLLVTGIIVLPHLARPSTRDLDSRDRISTLLMKLQARYMVGLSSLPGMSQTLYDQARALDVGPLPRRRRCAVLAGELAGPKEALAKLDHLDRLLAQSSAQPTQTDLAVKETLERLYGDYERGRLDAPSLDAEHRELLRQELDWFGELALAP